jgi:PAS domain S-box-containing protein
MSQLAAKQAKSATLKIAWVSAAIILVLSLALTYFALTYIKNNTLEEYGKSLDAVLDSNLQALLLWKTQQSRILEQIANNPLLLSINGSVLDENQTFSPELLETLRGEMSQLQAIKDSDGFILLSPSGKFIASNIELDLQIGDDTPLTTEYQELLQTAKGETTFIPPVRFTLQSGRFVEHDGLLTDSPVWLSIVSPIIKNQRIIGLLGTFYDPRANLSEITALGRIGESGETYLFNKQGVMLSDSRFTSALRGLELLNQEQSSILNIPLFDPGFNMLELTNKPGATQKLTLMAESAIKGNKDSNIFGYRDYRGVPVVGTWQWIDDLNMGITTEVDLREALNSYYGSRWVILVLVAISLFITFVLGAIMAIKSLQKSAALHAAADLLEQEVANRTQELKDALDTLESEQIVLQCLFDNIPDPIFCKDNNKRYIKGNNAFFKVFNRQAQDVIGHTDDEITNEKDRAFFLDTDQEVLDTGKTLVFERVANHENYKNRIFETRKSLIPFPGDVAPGIIAISRDITEQRRTEASLKQASIDAQAANKAKSEFLARMSHEIRTPMNGVIGMLELVLDTKLTDEQIQKLDVAKSSAKSLLGIINDILDFSRVEANKLTLDTIDFNLPKLVEDTAKALAIRAEAKGIELLVDVTPVKHLMVMGDPMRIRQIITNLLNNAIKFTETGQIHIYANTLFVDNKLTFTCSVSDTGIGIPEDKIEHLFDSFTQVDSSTTRIYGGSGLGLAICKRLCELMNGQVGVQSKIDKGSIFTFSVALEPSELDSKQIPPLSVTGLNVLVVDDNPINLDILTNQLSNISLNPTCESDPLKALLMLQENSKRFDFLITDMNMPGMDGLELVEKVRNDERLRELKIIMLSSMSFNLSRDELKHKGLDGCLLKPIASSDLTDVMRLLTADDAQRSLINEQTLMGYTKPTELSLPRYHHVLIVEDNPVNMLVAQGLMKKLGLRCSVTYNGQECIDALLDSNENTTFTLLLMDCQMPVLDGYDATTKIRKGEAGERYKNIPIIAMTANAMQGDKEKCLAYGMNFHVPKPIDTQHLVSVLSESFKLVPDILSKFDMPQRGEPVIDSQDDMAFIIPEEALATMDLKERPPSLLVDPAMYLQSLSVFKQQYQDYVFTFTSNVDNLNSLSKQLHTLKGSAGNMGFHALHDLCFRLEQEINSVQLSPSDIERLNECLKHALNDIELIKNANSSIVEFKGNKRAISDVYNEILPYAQKNTFVPLNLVNELKALANDMDERDEIDQVITLLDRFDYVNLTQKILTLL